MKKLTLHRTTVRPLTSANARSVVGGILVVINLSVNMPCCTLSQDCPPPGGGGSGPPGGDPIPGTRQF